MTPDAFMLDQPPCLPLVCSCGSPSYGSKQVQEHGTTTEHQEARGNYQREMTGETSNEHSCNESKSHSKTGSVQRTEFHTDSANKPFHPPCALQSPLVPLSRTLSSQKSVRKPGDRVRTWYHSESKRARTVSEDSSNARHGKQHRPGDKEHRNRQAPPPRSSRETYVQDPVSPSPAGCVPA